MMDGTAAINSTASFKKLDNAPLGLYSPRYIAIAYENGIEIISAIKDVSKVPIKNGRAPYILLTGSHTFPHKNPIPNVLIDVHDSTISVVKIPNIISPSKTLIAISNLLNEISHLSWPVAKVNLLFSTDFMVCLYNKNYQPSICTGELVAYFLSQESRARIQEI